MLLIQGLNLVVILILLQFILRVTSNKRLVLIYPTIKVLMNPEDMLRITNMFSTHVCPTVSLISYTRKKQKQKCLPEVMICVRKL